MNTKFCLLSLAAVCGLPVLSLAQGTYLRAPDGNPPNAVVVAPGGNVGIGPAQPDEKLHIYGHLKVSGYLKLDNGETRSWWLASAVDPNDGKLGIYDATLRLHRLVIDPSGAIGIGTSFPQAKLDVAGNIRCTVLDLTSDRNAKTSFAPVDSRAVLERVARLPITTWQYTNAPGVKHIGPVAQDFQAAFNLGSDDKHIATVDADGVALASIQALYQELQQRDKQLKEKEARLDLLETRVRRLEQQLTGNAALMNRMEKLATQFHSSPADIDTAPIGSEAP